MKTIGLILFALLTGGISQEAGVVTQGDKSAHKPCVDLKASPASEGDEAAFKGILDALHVDMDILLYVSHDSMMKNYAGAMSFRCPVDNHELYETDENWTIYDPELIQGDAARDFVFAHEIAHHMNGDTTSGKPRGKELELRADYNGAKYLLQLGWNKARLLYALDLLNLPEGPQPGYPTLEERKATVESAAEPPGPAAPTDLQAVAVMEPAPDESIFDRLLRNGGSVRFQSARTLKYVCARGTPDPRIPSTRHFDFFDNCEPDSNVSFALVVRYSPQGNSEYWIEQIERKCPEYSLNCRYVLESVGQKLQFWNQDLAADRYGWELELGEEELFSIEAIDSSRGLVRVKAQKGGYIFVDPDTAQLQVGKDEAQAAEFQMQFDSEGSK